MIRSLVNLVILAAAALAAAAPAQPAAYFNDFEKTPPGKPPEEFQSLGGEFAVKVEGANHFLEVTAEPVEPFGLLFGPDGVTLADVGAKIYATSNGHRFPEFGIGCGDAGGYKLMLMPGQAGIELRRGDESMARTTFDKWKSGQWFSFRIKVTAAGEGKWRIQGKVWLASEKEPQEWTIGYDTTEAPSSGRSSIWASTYSGTPVRFDDLSAVAEGAGKGG